MKRDRNKICEIISEMLDNPDKYEIYPTTVAYDKLEKYIESERHILMGLLYGHICSKYENAKGYDIRTQIVPDLIDDILKQLEEVHEDRI